MKALQCGDKITLDFTKILDRVELGGIEPPPPSTDRTFWEKKASPVMVSIADRILDIIQSFSPGYQLNYTKGYIGLMKDGNVNNFALFSPKKKFLRFSIKLPKSEEIEAQLDEAGLEVINYSSKSGRYKIRLYKEDIEKNSELLTRILQKAYGEEPE